MDIALLLVVNCKFDIIIDRTLYIYIYIDSMQLHDIALYSDM